MFEEAGGGDGDLVLTSVNYKLTANSRICEATGSNNLTLTGNDGRQQYRRQFRRRTRSLGFGGNDTLNGGAGADLCLAAMATMTTASTMRATW